MENGNQPINPLMELDFTESAIQGRTVFQGQEYGLTKREYFAGLAMQGLCANSIPGSHHNTDNLINEAISYADELLKQLEKPTE